MSGFAIFREDWSLHRKGHIDQQRHLAKVREAIRENLADIVSEESIILSEGNRVVRVPIRQLEEYRFRFDPGRQDQAGQGDGETRVGDVVAREGQKGRGAGGSRAGELPGSDYYEAEITVDEISELLFADLGLPYLRPRRRERMEVTDIRFRDVRRTGLVSNLDKKRTILETLRRNALRGRPGLHGIAPEDLRFKVWDPVVMPQSNAAVLAMMDTSGSMGTFEKYIARSFFFWMVRFLRTRYRSVQIVFLAHDVEAREVTEEEFFTKGESGGTRCSAVYQLALDMVARRFPPEDWNIYPFHFSDGDNLTSDNDNCVKLVRRLLGVANAVGYGEIAGPHYAQVSTSTLMNVYKKIEDERFIRVTIRSKADIYPALRRFFATAPERAEGVPS